MNQGAVSLKIQVQSMNSGLFHMAENRFVHEMEHEKNLPCEGDVYVTNAFIRLSGWREHFRPCLALQGEVRSIRGDFPCGVSEVSFGDGPERPKVSYEYKLTNRELAKLCMSGMFDDGFRCPDIFFHNTFQLPMTCDCSALPPEQGEDVPLLFVNINKPQNLVTSSLESGYTIDDYFVEKQESKELYQTREEFGDELVAEAEPHEAPVVVADIVDELMPATLTPDEPEPEVVEEELSEEEKELRKSLARIEARKKQAEAEAVARKAAEIAAMDADDSGEKTLSEDSEDKQVVVPAALDAAPAQGPRVRPGEPAAVPSVRHYDDADEDDYDDISEDESPDYD